MSRSMRMQKKANQPTAGGLNYVILGINTQDGSTSHHKNSPAKLSGQKRKFMNTTYVTSTNQAGKNINFKEEMESHSKAGIKSQISKKVIESEEREIRRMIKPGRHSRLDPLIMTGKVPRENKSHFELKTQKHNIMNNSSGFADPDLLAKPKKGEKRRQNESSGHRNRTSKS